MCKSLIKMKKLKAIVIRLVIVTMCFGYGKIFSQNVSLVIVENSIKVCNDSLYFKLRLHNLDSVPFAFYNLYLSPGFNFITGFEEVNKDSIMPSLLVNVYDKTGKLPKKLRVHTGPIDTTGSWAWETYNIIKPNESLDIDCKLYLWHINLKKGRYKLQIQYLSNEIYYKEDFLNEKQRKPTLINCRMFEGILKSNTEIFYFIPPPKEYYHLDN